MHALVCLCVSTIIVASTSASSPPGYPGYGNPGGYVNPGSPGGYGNPGSPGSYGNPSGYGGSPSSYGSPGGYGGHHGIGHALISSMFNDKQLTPVDKLFSRLESVLAQVKFYSEQVDALSALLAVQMKALDTLSLESVGTSTQTNYNQTATIQALESEVESLFAETSATNSTLQELSQQNSQNTASQAAAEVLWGQAQAAISEEERSISDVTHSISHLKERMLTIKDIVIESVQESESNSHSRLNAVIARETRRICETGQVTLDANDLRVEYQYQNKFATVPQILWGLCGVNFNLDAKKDSMFFGSGFGHSEPEAMGVRVHTYSTQTGLSVKAFDYSFGDTDLVSVDVCFHACSIGPGVGVVDH